MVSNMKYLIRPATPQDIPAMARVRVETQKISYRDFVPDEYLDNQTGENHENTWRQLLLEKGQLAQAFVAENEQGEILATSLVRQANEPGERRFKGEIYVLYVLPAFQNLGIGRGLMKACVEYLADHALIPILLWTFADGPGRGFYEALGGTLVGEREIVRAGKRLIEVCYVWDDIPSLIEHLADRPI
jgi:ribosomal protein S18 acetylase RimI-like enzyme